jgi:hexosaminidase
MNRLVYLRSRSLRQFCTALTAVVLALPILAQRSFNNTLMPQPAKLSTQTGLLVVTGRLRISLDGAHDPLLERAAHRMIFRLERQTALQLDQAFDDEGNPSIRVRVADHAIQRPSEGVDESYTLDVHDGAATLQASTDFGALHGMETLLQLVQEEPQGYVLPAVHIEDAPRFPWRGLLLDPGRHFLPVSNVLRTLDAMAAVKMNVLHWHLTEDQGFRIESKRFPKLQELGSDGQYYTQDEVRQVVAYATDRGIRVVPEFDMPGHSTTWLIGYPELASKPGSYHVERTNGIKDAAMDPTRESTYRFLDSFIEEMTSLFPDGYIHIGGDESNGKDWLGNSEIVRFMHQHNMKKTSELQAYFNARVQKVLLKHQRRMVGWDEILQPDLSSDVVVQNWHGIEFLVDSARQGHRGILSKPFYLDHNYSAADMYAADPIPSADKLTPAQEKLILGGEACMWGEQVDSSTAESRTWPRAASVAERLWSPASIRDPQDMYRRLAVMSRRLDGLGVTHVSNPERGFRQITGGNASALELFASVVQPVDMGQRSKEQHTSPLTSMTNVVDFAVFDPLSGEVFAQQVAAYLRSSRALEGRQHAAARAQLEQTFNSWSAAASQLSVQTATNRRLESIAERQNQWLELATLGLQSMALIESRHSPSDAWILSQQTLLKSCAQPQELVDFVVLAPLGDLVKATSRASAN